MNTLRPTCLFLLLVFAIAAPSFAQETATPEATAPEAVSEESPATSSETVTEEAASAVEEPVAEESAVEEPATEPAVEEEPASEETEDTEEEVAEEEVAEEENTTDWAGLIERAPVFLSITHHAVIHLPIALWLFGAFFVVVGVVIPSLKNQIPVACLIGGAITSVPAVLSGWWYAEHEWGDDWREFDWASLRENGWSDVELITQHRWIGVALIAASFLLSIIAIIAYRKENRLLGFIWRVGLIGLAVAVAWEGHIGGELIQGEGFLEEAFELWLHPE